MKILIALVLGIVTGLVLGPNSSYLKPIGTVFLSLINMIIIPLVFASMTSGIASIYDPKRLSRVGLKTIALYLATTLLAITISLCLANLLTPGADMGLETQILGVQEPMPIGKIFLSMLPANPISAMAQGNVMQLIIFSIFLGLAINHTGEKGQAVLRFMESFADIMYRMTSMIMEFAPIGVFAIMAKRSDYKLLCAWFEGEMIAMGILQEENSILHATCCGMDYNHSSKSFAYSMLSFEFIRFAIEAKKYQYADSGLTANEAKQNIGFIPIPIRIDVYAKNSFIRGLLKFLSSFLIAEITTQAKLKIGLKASSSEEKQLEKSHK